jgi:hypothetical protein
MFGLKPIPEIAHWRAIWSVRLAISWAVVSGAYMALPAFSGLVSPFAFAALCIGFSLAMLFARLTHQPGIHDD